MMRRMDDLRLIGMAFPPLLCLAKPPGTESNVFGLDDTK